MNCMAQRPGIHPRTNISVLDDVNVEAPTFNAALTNAELADAVRRALCDDAATRTLDVEVEVWDRVAHLRGVVAARGDVAAAEAVAARVRGIAEVADDLHLQT